MNGPGRAGFSRRLLRRLLPGGEGERLLSELDEFREARAARGRGGRLWYARQVVMLVARWSVLRLRGSMSGLALDLRAAVRSLRRTPGHAVPAALILALTIGVDTAVYSVADAVLLAPLPYRDADRLVEVWMEPAEAPEGGARRASVTAFLAWREGARSAEIAGAWSVGRATLLGRGDPRDVLVGTVSPGLLSSLGLVPVLGRGFRSDDVGGASPVLVLSHASWVSSFGSDPGVLGQSVELWGEAHRVVGVAAPGFRLPLDQELFGWTPSEPRPYGHVLDEIPDYGVVARVPEGIELSAVQQEMEALRPRVSEPRLGSFETRVGWLDELYRPPDDGILTLLAAVTLVLLVGCLNTSQLLVSRGLSRRPELAVRRALGSGRAAAGRGLFLEAGLLAAGGTLLGLLLAVGLLRVFVVFDPGHLPGWADVHITPRVLIYLVGLSVGATLLAGWLPARLAGRTSPSAALGGARTSTASRAEGGVQLLLLAGQAASAVVLLAGAALLVRSWIAVQAVDPGLDDQGLYVARVVLPSDRYPPGDGALHVRVFEELRRSLEDRSGVQAASVSTGIPVAPGLDFEQPFRAEGRPAAPDIPVSSRLVGPGWFTTVGARVVSGRDFRDSDDADQEPVAVLNRAAARLLFGGEVSRATGRVVVEPRRGGDTRYRVVGVVDDIRNDGLDRPPPPRVYLPWLQSRPFGRMWIAVRSSLAADDAFAEIRAAVSAVDPELPLVDATPMTDVLERSVAARRFNLFLLAVLAGLAVTVSLMGVSGMVAFSVARRRREMGIRRALGARQLSVIATAVGPSLAAFAAGAVVGLGVTALLADLLRRLLFGIEALDAWSLAGAALVLCGAGAVAALPPAWRAARSEPAETLAGP